MALAKFMRLSLLKAAGVAIRECHVAGNPGRPSFSTHVVPRLRRCKHGAPVQELGVRRGTVNFPHYRQDSTAAGLVIGTGTSPQRVTFVATFVRAKASTFEAEPHAILTRVPGKYRISGEQAMLFLGDLRERLSLITLDEEEYFRALRDAASPGVAGGAICDAMLAHCALKARAETIYS